MSKEKECTAERKLFEYVAYIGLDYKEIREKMESGDLPEMELDAITEIIYFILPSEIEELITSSNDGKASPLDKAMCLEQAAHVFNMLHRFYLNIYEGTGCCEADTEMPEDDMDCALCEMAEEDNERMEQLVFNYIAYNSFNFDDLRQKMKEFVIPELDIDDVTDIIFSHLPGELEKLNSQAKAAEDLISKNAFLAKANGVYASLYNSYNDIYIEDEEQVAEVLSKKAKDDEICFLNDPVIESGAGSWEEYYGHDVDE